MPEHRVLVRVDFTATDTLGQTGWLRAAVEIDNQAGQDQPALIAAAAAFYGVPAHQVRAEQLPPPIDGRIERAAAHA